MSVTLAKNWQSSDHDRKTIVNSINFCLSEASLSCMNLLEYVIRKNGWKGVVLKSTESQWTGVFNVQVKYTIKGEDYTFLIIQ